MVDENLCPYCNTELPVNAPSGVCPKCLLKAGLAEDTDATLEGPLVEGPGTRIGRYEVLEQIGEGGMGLVYLAQQKRPVKRRVALKIIKPGMDSKQVIARFEAERQALAVLDHPNIAHVFDAGTTKAGRPYFAMEHVKGLPITRYCDRHRLTIEQRLRLFERVCEGVHHAHQKGIIHRDLKPSNILVSVHGDRAVPKIIDFGIAKAVTQPLTEKTFVTFQNQLIGTPEYMSPEQVDFSTQDIDIRSDIYSLGVLLYELLAGVLPFGQESFARLGLAEIQRTIREQEPASPSIRLTNLGEEAHGIAASRSTQMITLARRLHRELEWVPLKAMRKDRCRRYRSASEMADDVRNYLDGLPLIAGPETMMYRTRKFVGKHAGSVITVALVAAAIIAGLIVSTALYHRTEKALGREAAARTQADDAKRLEADARIKAEQAEELAKEQRQEAKTLLARAQIERGVKRVNEGDFSGLLDLVDAHETAQEIPELKDQAGRLWAVAYELCRDRLKYVLPGSNNVVYSPNGKLFAAIQADVKTVRVFDTDTYRPHGPLLELEKDIHAIAFSPDSRLLVTHSVDGLGRLWDTVTGTPVGPMLRHPGVPMVRFEYYLPSYAAAFSPDGRLLATAGFDGTVQLWRTDTGLPYGPPFRHSDDVWSVAFSPDSTLLASGSRETRIWDVGKGELCGSPVPHGIAVENLVFSPDGEYLVAIARWDQRVDFIRVDTGELHRSLHVPVPTDGAFSPDGTYMAFTSLDWYTQFLETASGEVLGERMHQEGRVWSVAYSPDGRLLATIAMDKTARLWEVPSGKPYGPPLRHLGGQHWWGDPQVAFSPDGMFLASSTASHTTQLWQVDQRIHTEVVPWPNGDQLGTISPDGKVGAIVSGSTVQLYDTATVQAREPAFQHSSQVTDVIFSPDNRFLATVCADQIKVVRLWEVATGKPLKAIQADCFANAVSFSSDGKLLAVGSKDNYAQVFDVTTGQCIHTLRHDEWVLAVAFRPDNLVLAIALSSGVVQQWDLASGEHLGPPLQHAGFVVDAAYSPNGAMLATITVSMQDRERVVRLWDVSTAPHYHSLVLPFRSINEKTRLQSFGTTGQLLVNRRSGGKAQVWRLPSAPDTLDEIQFRSWTALSAQHNAQGQPTMIVPEQWQAFREKLQSFPVRKVQEKQSQLTVERDVYRVPLPSEVESEDPEIEAELRDIYRRVIGLAPPDSLYFTNTMNTIVQIWESLSTPQETIDYKHMFNE